MRGRGEESAEREPVEEVEQEIGSLKGGKDRRGGRGIRESVALGLLS